MGNWYNETEVYRWLRQEKPNLLAYAGWFAEQLQLAFNKGGQIRAGELNMEIDRFKDLLREQTCTCGRTGGHAWDCPANPNQLGRPAHDGQAMERVEPAS